MIEIPKAYIAKRRSQSTNVFNSKEVKEAIRTIYDEIRVANRQGSFGCQCRLIDLYQYAITEIQVYLESLGYDTTWDEEEELLYLNWENAQMPKEEQDEITAKEEKEIEQFSKEESVTIFK